MGSIGIRHKFVKSLPLLQGFTKPGLTNSRNKKSTPTQQAELLVGGRLSILQVGNAGDSPKGAQCLKDEHLLLQILVEEREEGALPEKGILWLEDPVILIGIDE